jgi:AraC-like DNA-binding protein
MRLAIQYIRHENQPIETVALRLGYGSLAAFSRAFKRIIGHAPGTLREVSQTPEEV